MLRNAKESYTKVLLAEYFHAASEVAAGGLRKVWLERVTCWNKRKPPASSVPITHLWPRRPMLPRWGVPA